MPRGTDATRRRVLASGAGLALLAIAPPAGAQQEREARARTFIDVLNSRDEQRWRDWIAASLAPQSGFSARDCLALFAKVRAATSRLDFVRLEDVPWIAPIVRVAGSRVWAKFDLFTEGAAPDRVVFIGALPWPCEPETPLAAGALSARAALRAIERRLEFAASHDSFSGAALMVAPGGRKIEFASGFADRNFDVRNTMQTRFHLGSAGKMFTAAAIARLIERGRLSFETRLAERLPEFTGAAGQATVEQLLTHRAGFGGLFDRDGYDRNRVYATQRELVSVFATAPMSFAPGAGVAYSNEGFVALAALVEAVSGLTFQDFLRQEIFAPIGMNDIDLRGIDAVSSQRAVGYRFTEDDLLGVGQRIANWSFVGASGANGAGGGYSTAGDMTTFMTALKQGRVIPQALLARFVSPYPGGLDGFGMGFQARQEQGKTMIGHDGGGPRSGINVDIRIVWDTAATSVVLGNYDAPFAQTLGRDCLNLLAAAA
jgi:CubicO group peptidase (beta-lactamase class C family)